VTAVSDREIPLPSDEQRERDRQLLQALDEHQSVGERYARTGEVPIVAPTDPVMPATAPRDPTPSGVVAPIATPRRRRRVLRAVGIVVTVTVVLVGAYALVSFWQVWSTGRSDQARAVDAIVVMGAAQYDGRPSPQLAARLDHALALWPEGLAPMIVVTGGNQPGDRFTEADASAAYLIERGVPADAIVLEEEGSSTFESLRNVAELVGVEAGGSVESVLIVTDPYHSLRSRLTAQEVGFEAFVSPTTTSVVSGAAEIQREIAEAAGVAIGRIIGFERLSDLTD
jgi:uncharacterized SAM-binding protein YcdF (DUF218 family)